MIEKQYRITLSDGTAIANLRLNGNNFISEDPIDQKMFLGKLKTVTISDGETEEVHENMELVQITTYDNINKATGIKNTEYWFVLRDIPEKEMKEKKLRSDVDYLIMMSNLEF